MMLKDIAQYITTNLSNYKLGDNLYMATSPAINKPHICLYEYAGEPTNKLSGILKPGLQINSLSTKYEVAYNNIKEIVNLIDKIGKEEEAEEGVFINGTWYFDAERTQSGITQLGVDENNVITLSVNFYITQEDKT